MAMMIRFCRPASASDGFGTSKPCGHAGVRVLRCSCVTGQQQSRALLSLVVPRCMPHCAPHSHCAPHWQVGPAPDPALQAAGTLAGAAGPRAVALGKGRTLGQGASGRQVGVSAGCACALCPAYAKHVSWRLVWARCAWAVCSRAGTAPASPCCPSQRLPQLCHATILPAAHSAAAPFPWLHATTLPAAHQAAAPFP